MTLLDYWCILPGKTALLFCCIRIDDRRYNAHRGNTDEDNSLFSMACDILQGSSLRSADRRHLGIPDMDCLLSIDWLDNLLQAIEIVLQKQSDLSASQETSNGPVIRFQSVDRPQMRLRNS